MTFAKYSILLLGFTNFLYIAFDQNKILQIFWYIVFFKIRFNLFLVHPVKDQEIFATNYYSTAV